jgi:glutathione S-transferase
MITLYQYEISPFCDKVRRVLHLKRQPYTIREVTLLETGRGYLKKLSPAARLPVIDDGETRIGDSTDIIRYLDERYPEPSVIPADPRDRALAYMLEDWADESLYFYEMYLRFALKHNAKRWVPVLSKSDGGLMRALASRLVPRAIGKKLRSQGLFFKGTERIVIEVESHIAAISDLLGDREWLVGDHISSADISVFAQLYCIAGADEGARACDRHPTVRAWMKRVDVATGPASSTNA